MKFLKNIINPDPKGVQSMDRAINARIELEGAANRLDLVISDLIRAQIILRHGRRNKNEKR